MDFPVEATVLLNKFPDKTQVRKILWSHGFVVSDLSRDEVRVKGTFFKLKDAKASLEELLLKSQTRRDIVPSSHPPVVTASSGAISKYYTGNSSDLSRSRQGSRKQASPTITSSSSISSNHQTTPAYSPRPDQQYGSLRLGKESFIIDADVLEYAEKLRKNEIDRILENHIVRKEVRPLGESCSITLHGKSAKTAAFNLQSLLLDLNKTLRTQEVSRREMCREGNFLFGTIQRNGNVWKTVLVCERDGGLHLIGPSLESYELKQRLLGRPIDHSGQRGRTSDRSSRGRSSSLPPVSRRTTGRDPSPAGAAGYTPAKYQSEEQKGAEPKRGTVDTFKKIVRGRSFSESRQKNRPERTNGNMQEMVKTQKSPKTDLKQPLFIIGDIKKKWKNRKK